MPREAESTHGNQRGNGRVERSSHAIPKAWVKGTSRMSPMWSGVGMGSRSSEAEGRSSHSKINVPKGRNTPKSTRRPSQTRLMRVRWGVLVAAGFEGSRVDDAPSGTEAPGEAVDGGKAPASTPST